MRKIIILLILSTNLIMSKDVVVADLASRKAITGVSFSCKEYGTTSNKFGIVNLKVLDECDSIKIKHISFIEINIFNKE